MRDQLELVTVQMAECTPGLENAFHVEVHDACALFERRLRPKDFKNTKPYERNQDFASTDGLVSGLPTKREL